MLWHTVYVQGNYKCLRINKNTNNKHGFLWITGEVFFKFVCAYVSLWVEEAALTPGELITVSGWPLESLLSAIRIWLYFPLSRTPDSCVILNERLSGADREGCSGKLEQWLRASLQASYREGSSVFPHCAHVVLKVGVWINMPLAARPGECSVVWVCNGCWGDWHSSQATEADKPIMRQDAQTEQVCALEAHSAHCYHSSISAA